MGNAQNQRYALNLHLNTTVYLERQGGFEEELVSSMEVLHHLHYFLTYSHIHRNVFKSPGKYVVTGILL